MSRGGVSPYNGSPGPEPRERRAGGYGGFYDGVGAGSSERVDDQDLESPGANWRRRADRGDREYSERQRERNRSRANGGRGGARRIEDILADIQHDWPFMTTDDCVPVKVALQLSDSSSLGRADQYGTFKDQHKQLQKALRSIVNEHHQGFNSSIGTFHKIQNNIANSQHKVRTLRNSLVAAKTDLSTTKPELRGLATSSQTYDDMLQILGQIEQLQSIQERLDTRITEKRFLTAVDILQDGLRLIRRSEMDSIGALADLRSYLTNQETSLKDILVEELHSHLYLKSPYCQDRWKAYATVQSPGSDTTWTPPGPIGPKAIYVFLDKMDLSQPMIEDASRNPEADSFYYIQLLIESLNKMGRLDDAVESIKQRLPTELDRLVDRTNNEVDQRHSTALRASVTKEKNTLGLNFTENDVRAVVINDLLWTLYSKLEAVAESHRVFHDVVSGIGKRENLRNTSQRTGGFKELWQLYQNEMKKILHDYLATDGELSFRSGIARPGATNIFQKNWRDKSKKMFKLNDTDKKATDIIGDQEDLESILKSSVPGLVSDSRRPADATAEESTRHHDGSATGHKLLIEPNVFNMGLLLPPSLSFLQRLKDIVPPDSEIVTSTLTSFLDDFLVNVFHPQLDETLTELSAQTFVEADAFQEDPQWQTVARKPIFKGTLAFFNLITAFCKMLDTIPHDQAFSQLIITQMVTYYDKCFGLYKSLVAKASSGNDGSESQITPALSDSGTFLKLLTKTWMSEENTRLPLIEEQTTKLLGEINQRPLEAKDLILNHRTIDSLCLLYTSMKWLASKTSQLRHITSISSDSSRRDTSQVNPRWTLLGPNKPRDKTSLVQLPMTAETAFLFDGVLTSYNELALKSLCALHTEVRCRVLYNLKSYLQTSYLLPQPVLEPDPSILALNTDLVRFDETIRTALPIREHDFITTGLAFLLSTHLIDLLQTHIQALNVNGAHLLLLTVIVLQQNLKNIEPQTQNDEVLGNALDRSKRYIEIFLAGPDEILVQAQEKGAKGMGFSLDQLKKLVELCYSEDLASDRREVSVLAKRRMGEQVLTLEMHLWQS